VKEITDKRRTRLVQTDELDRIMWLSRFCQGAVEKQELRHVRARRLIKWTCSLGVTYLASLVLINSYNYHPVYVGIIEREKQEIADAIKKSEQEKEQAEE
jgi:hypothetical protein